MSTTTYSVQGGFVERAHGVIVRDDVRHAGATTHDDAMRSARTFAADGFTVWIWAVAPGQGIMPCYRKVDTLQPARPAGTSARRPPQRRVVRAWAGYDA